MISLITYKNANQQIEIIADDQGIDDMILYLQGIKNARDHMHLIFESEINNYPIPAQHAENVIIVKQVKLQYESSSPWGVQSDEDHPKS